MHCEVKLSYKGAIRTDILLCTDPRSAPRYNSVEHRELLYAERGRTCAECSAYFKPEHLEVDHIIARAKGGTDHIQNFQLLCANCNRFQGNRSMEYLKAKLQL